jgi:hypothetical protein
VRVESFVIELPAELEQDTVLNVLVESEIIARKFSPPDLRIGPLRIGKKGTVLPH